MFQPLDKFYMIIPFLLGRFFSFSFFFLLPSKVYIFCSSNLGSWNVMWFESHRHCSFRGGWLQLNIGLVLLAVLVVESVVVNLPLDTWQTVLIYNRAQCSVWKVFYKEINPLNRRVWDLSFCCHFKLSWKRDYLKDSVMEPIGSFWLTDCLYKNMILRKLVIVPFKEDFSAFAWWQK